MLQQWSTKSERSEGCSREGCPCVRAGQVVKQGRNLVGTVWCQETWCHRKTGGARVWQSFQASGQGSQLQSAIPGLGSQLGVAIYCKLLWGVSCSLSRDPASSRTTVKPAFLSQEEGADMCQSGLQICARGFGDLKWGCMPEREMLSQRLGEH